MSEELEVEVVEEIAEELQTEVEPEVELSYDDIQIAKASKGGWKPIEEWEGPKEDWVDARDFNIRGEFIGKLREAHDQIKNTDDRIANLNAFHDAQMKQTIADLTAQKKEAILNGDAELVDKLHGQIANVAPQQQQPVHQSDTLLDTWNANNTWVLEDTPKASRAKEIYAREVTIPGRTMAQVLSAVNADMEKNFPTTTKVAQSEGGSRPKGAKSVTKALTMSDITPEEANLRSFNSKWSDDKVFLKAIADSRKI